jgi:alcohol dehydrogenase class IV
MRFELATASRIVFGPGTVREIAPATKSMGRCVLLVTGRSMARAEIVTEDLDDKGIGYVRFSVSGEPTIQTAREGAALARTERCDVVVSVGGGSAVDAGKAIAALIGNGGDPLDYLEVIGEGRKLERPPAPFIAAPTTAGTGSEVTRNAVLGSPEHRVKASLRSPLMLPDLAVVDPELTAEAPPAVTASTGLDALTQLIEPYVSARANAMTDLYCLEGIRRSARSLKRAYEDGSNSEARTDMALASLMGGLSLANAGLGVVHGFAAPVGGMFPAPHGAVCAAILPHGMRTNIQALRERGEDPEKLERYQTVARLLTGNDSARAEDGIEWAFRACEELRIPTLKEYGLSREDVPVVVEKASRASSMKANPVKLTTEELAEVLAAAI